MKPKLRVSSSIVNFREKAEKIWELERYKFPEDVFKDVVYFGLYHIGDYFHYIVNRGKKTIVWAGSDIQALLKHKIPWHLLFRSAKNYVENGLEQKELKSLGIDSEIRPSFLEDKDDFPVCFNPTENPQVYISSNPGREEEYGINLVIKLAPRLPDIGFHIYGTDFHFTENLPKYENLYYHGRVPLDQFNEEVKHYHCALRPNEHDGFSENLAKSILMAQYPIARIKYPHIWHYTNEEELVRQLKRLKEMVKPNLVGREFWRKNINNYPWVNGI